MIALQFENYKITYFTFQASDQFRSRLQTYPGPEKTLSRPNLKYLKTKCKLDKDQSSSIQDLVASGAGCTVSPLVQPPSPCSRAPAMPPTVTHSPFQRHKQLHFVQRAQQPEHGKFFCV